jgi:hypothetical protein
METRKDGGEIDGSIPTPDPLFQNLPTWLLDALNQTSAANGFLEFSRIAAFEDKLNIGRMSFQNSAQKGLGLGRQVIRPLEPQDGLFSAASPNMQLLAPFSQGAILSTRTG